MSMVDLRGAPVDTRRVPPRIPRDIIELIRQMIIDGKSHDDIKAACLDRGRLVSDGPIYQQRTILREMGIEFEEKPVGRPASGRTEELRAQASELARQGKTHREIGAELGVSHQYVQQLLARVSRRA